MLTILGRLSGVIIYNNVKNKSKGGIIMRRKYLDNIRWVTILIVIIYHVIYMFNGVTTYGVIGPFSEDQPQDIFLYFVLLVLFFDQILILLVFLIQMP